MTLHAALSIMLSHIRKLKSSNMTKRGFEFEDILTIMQVNEESRGIILR